MATKNITFFLFNKAVFDSQTLTKEVVIHQNRFFKGGFFMSAKYMISLLGICLFSTSLFAAGPTGTFCGQVNDDGAQADLLAGAGTIAIPWLSLDQFSDQHLKNLEVGTCNCVTGEIQVELDREYYSFKTITRVAPCN